MPTFWQHAEGVWILKEENTSGIKQFRIVSLLSVECSRFSPYRFLMKNTYIDTSVQKGGVPRIPGYVEHSGMITQLIRVARESKGDLVVLWLDLANAYGLIG